MAKWKNVHSATGGTLSGSIEYDGSVDNATWRVQQDEKPFLDQAKLEREATTKHTHMNHRKFATIPDIVALEILQKYGIDLHDPLIMHDTDKMKRFKHIVMTEYKHLVVNDV